MHSKSVTLPATNLGVALYQDALMKCMVDNAAMGALISFALW